MLKIKKQLLLNRRHPESTPIFSIILIIGKFSYEKAPIKTTKLNTLYFQVNADLINFGFNKNYIILA